MLNERVFQCGVAGKSVADRDVASVQMLASLEVSGARCSSTLDPEEVVVVSSQSARAIGVDTGLQQSLSRGQLGQVRVVGVRALGCIHNLPNTLVAVVL